MSAKDILQNIFSVKNEYGEHNCHKVINILGIKVKLKRGKNQIPANLKKTPVNTFATIHYVASMLKAYGIRHIVASPGAQNSGFNRLVSANDDFFICHSVVDERSAVYVATGIANETGEPVVVTCTEATASRNYLSGMTESFYRNIPIIALTCFNPHINKFSLSPQHLDRSSTQNDIKKLSVKLPRILDNISRYTCLTFLNAALSTAKYKNKPVHIDCPSTYASAITTETLPENIWTTKYYFNNFENQKQELKNKRIAIFIGSHHKFNIETQNAISDFAKSYCAPVFCDHTSNYNGENKISVSQLTMLVDIKKYPEIIIDIGGISGNYTLYPLYKNAKVWRISEDGDFKCRMNHPVSKIFACTEKRFFQTMKNNIGFMFEDYYAQLKTLQNSIKIPDLPLSTPLIAQHYAKYIPDNSSLHLAILHSLRCMNLFNLDKSINVNCNVGGFGIDGAVSTLVGQSLANPDKKCFGLIGDLAFFYDMNAIGNRDIKNNLRILLVNNNRGEEFNLALLKGLKQKDNNLDKIIAAMGHNRGGAKGWAQACGFEYLSANSKDEFLSLINDFCNKDFNKPVFFEVLTTNEDEIKGLELIKKYNKGEDKNE